MAKKKRKKIKIKKVKKAKEVKEVKRFDKKQQIANILVWFMIILLLFNAVSNFFFRDYIISQMTEQEIQQLEDMDIGINDFKTLLTVISIIWIVFAVFLFFLKGWIEKRKAWWGLLLITSIVIFFLARIETAVIGAVASVFYALRKNK